MFQKVAKLIAENTAEQETKTTEKTTEKILSMVKANPAITTEELAAACNLTADGIYYHTKKLKQQGILIREGGKKSGHWIIKS